MTLVRCIGLALLLLFASACNKADPVGGGSEATAVQAQSAAAPSVASPSSPPTLPEPAAIEVSAAREVLDAWLRAQNQGDFAAYSALYAKRMMGIKRVGTRSTSFDREGWLKDRETMFRRPVSVSADAPKFITTPGTAIVHFKQTWQSPTFSDVGEKQLVLVPSDGQLKIVREEMLSSKRAPTAVVGLEQGRDFSLLKTVGSRRFAILEGETAEEYDTIVVDHPLFLSTSVALRPLAPSLQPAKAKAANGKRFLLYSGDSACESTALNVWILAEAYADDATYSEWVGQDGKGAARPATQASIATSIWRLAAGSGRFLVVELAPTSGCVNATVARLASLPTPRAWFAEPCTSELTQRALGAFRELPGYVENQAVWRKSFPTEYWEGTNIAGTAEGLRVACYGDGETHYIGLNALRFGCSEFDGEIWALYKVQNPLVRLTALEPEATYRGGVLPKLGLDVNGDGLPEFFDSEVVVGRAQGSYGILGNVFAPVFGCRC
jgi:hypothetical protein